MNITDMDRALARVVVCRTLQRGLALPGEAARRALLGAEGRQARRAAAALLDDQEGAVGDAVAELEETDSASLETLCERHQAIFGHTLRGAVCPYETEHGSQALFQQGQELADIAGYYLAFGLRPPDDGAERVDHIACEFEFMQLLALKEAYALETDDAEMLVVTRDAWRSFMREHIGRFGRAFGAALARADSGGFHGAMGSLCAAFIETECRRLGLPLGPELMPLRPEEDNVPMACGSGCGDGGLLQIGSPDGEAECDQESC